MTQTRIGWMAACALRVIVTGWAALQTGSTGMAMAAASVTISPGGGGDDTSRIQQAIDKSGSSGAVRFEAGIYKLSGPLHLRANRTYIGEGSWDSRYGSVLFQQASGAPIFVVDGLVGSVTITGLTFDGAIGANAKGIAGGSRDALLANSTLRDNYFLTGLAEGIDTPMQSTRIERNQFGLNGDPNNRLAKRRHIHSASPPLLSTADPGVDSNANWIVGNHFSSAIGSESVLFDQGVQLHIVGNRFEGNEADTTLRIRGMFQVLIEGNWFERNHGEAQMMFSNATTAARGNYIVRLENNYYNMQGFGAPNVCKGSASEGNCFVFEFEPGRSTATHVFMGYDTGAYFSPTADLTANELTITAPLCLQNYQGNQAGKFNICP
jgi:hypothetical protein